MRSTIFYVLGLLSGIALSFFYALANEVAKATYGRLTRTSKPLFSSETAKVARLALIRAEDVFQQSVNSAGGLLYPWVSRTVTVTVEQIQDDLRAAIAAIKDQSFRDSAEVVKVELAKVRQWTPRGVPTYYSSADFGGQEPDEVKRARHRIEKVQDKQFEAADIGLAAAKNALAKLDALSLNQ